MIGGCESLMSLLPSGDYGARAPGRCTRGIGEAAPVAPAGDGFEVRDRLVGEAQHVLPPRRRCWRRLSGVLHRERHLPKLTHYSRSARVPPPGRSFFALRSCFGNRRPPRAREGRRSPSGFIEYAWRGTAPQRIGGRFLGGGSKAGELHADEIRTMVRMWLPLLAPVNQRRRPVSGSGAMP